MATGWIRAWAQESRRSSEGAFGSAKERSTFRRGFTTPLRAGADEASAEVATLRWGDTVELPQGLGDADWTEVEVDGEAGFVATAHVVEVAWVARTDDRDPGDAFAAELRLDDGSRVDLLWGDLVQIESRSGDSCRVRARGRWGTMDEDRLDDGGALLEMYVIDVGQGDGVLVRFPEGHHMLVDGGLPRGNQMTGKNAADFVDWKFHVDYGHWRIGLDAMVSSHCDYDHYGGLWDLLRVDAAEDDDLDCVDIGVDQFWHPGLSRWERRTTDPPHKDDLGQNDGGWFVRLLGDRADAEATAVNGAPEELGGDWKNFIADLLERGGDTEFVRVGVSRKTLRGGGPLPRLWADRTDVAIRAMAPVTVERADGTPTLKDLGNRGQNTNGHSLCLRLDHGAARFLLTGDLNSKSMEWLLQSYCDRSGAWACDVAKACHHGSADVSYRFLEEMKAGATIISSGDAEGHAHPRPEIVAASAVSGHVTVDRENDRLVTPLVYMTEIERSVALGQVTHIGFRDHPADPDALAGTLFGLPFRDISEKAYLTRDDRRAMEADPDHADQIERDAIARERTALRDLDGLQRAAGTRADYHYRSIHKLFQVQYGTRSVWRSRIMTENHYGLVNVRTDGETVVCATMKESGDGWTVHAFPARFGLCPE